MANQKRFAQTYLYSTIGVVAMAVLLVAVNIIAEAVSWRADLTGENLYTLSSGTKEILTKLDTPVTIRFYYTRDAKKMPPFLKNYAQRVQDLLREYEEAAPDAVRVEKYNPEPFSDAEETAHLDGIYGQTIQGGDQIYLGLAVSCLDETATIEFLSPNRESMLEYDITHAIHQVTHPEKPVLGVMSSLPLLGTQMPPQMRMRRQQQEPWVIAEQLKRDYEVRRIQPDSEQIPADVDVLLLVHPKDLSDTTLFAIDQYVLGGGPVLAFLDPMSAVESFTNPQAQMGRQSPGSSSLGRLTDVWKIEFNTDKVVGDLEYATRVSTGAGQPQTNPAVMTLDEAGLNDEEPATSELDTIMMAFAGAFTGDAAEGIEKTVLIESSENVKLVEKFMARMGGRRLQDAEDLDSPQALAIRLSGTFKTAFPEGKPVDQDAENNAGNDEENEADAAGDEATLKESAARGLVVLVGDADMLYDDFTVRKQNFLGQQLVRRINDNLTFVQNLLEQLSGDPALIGIRSRGSTSRPFEVVREMRAEAERKYQGRIEKLEEEVNRTQQKIRELQAEKSENQKFLLSPKQRRAIEKLREKQTEARRELHEVRKRFHQDIDALEARFQVINIVLMPAVVIVIGIALAVIKRKRMTRR